MAVKLGCHDFCEVCLAHALMTEREEVMGCWRLHGRWGFSVLFLGAMVKLLEIDGSYT